MNVIYYNQLHSINIENTCHQSYFMYFPQNETFRYIELYCDELIYDEIEVIGRLFVNPTSKSIYIIDIICNRNRNGCQFDGEDIYRCGLNKFKKEMRYRNIISDFVDIFFGSEWIFHFGFRKTHKRNIMKKYRKNLLLMNGVDHLNNDLREYILNICRTHLDDRDIKITDNDIVAFVEATYIIKTKINDFKWGKVVSIELPCL